MIISTGCAEVQTTGSGRRRARSRSARCSVCHSVSDRSLGRVGRLSPTRRRARTGFEAAMIPGCGAGLAEALQQMDAAAPAFSAATRARRHALQCRYHQLGPVAPEGRPGATGGRAPRARFEVIASVDGPRDSDWEAAWLAELDRRVETANALGDASRGWTDVRARILERLGRV
jgi:hypothetical protein